MCLTQSMLESDTGPDYNIANTYREEDTFYITPQGPYKRKKQIPLDFYGGNRVSFGLPYSRHPDF